MFATDRLLKIIFVVSLLTSAVCAQETAQTQGVQAVPAAENVVLRLKGLDGKTYDTSEKGDEVWVVSFGATWCTPCTWELVATEELVVEYKGKPVRFLWVSVEDEEQTSDNVLRHYARERRLTIPVLRDSGGAAYSKFSTSMRLPLVVFYDRGGRFVAPAHRGMSQDIIVYKQMVRRRVDALLAAGTEGPKAGSESSRQ